uniref:Auxin-induced protein 5NG4 n=1 Tax=Solanum tuberosum TaxID=4113 RepID=M0ZY75_SOLTU
MKGSSWKEMLMPSVGMIFAIIAIVISMIISKIAMSKGLSSFIIVVYSNAIATLILFPPSIFIFITRYFGQICDYVGISYSSPTLATAMLNLIPGFTFILAITFRMEVINWKSWSSYAKVFGTFVLIGGAFVLTFYKGPPIINQHLTSTFSSQQNWILGGVILACESMSASLWYIIQGIVGIAFRSCMTTWCLKKTDPLFVSMFKPFAIVFALLIGTFCFRDVFYLGSLVGSVTTVIGFYGVMWGKTQEKYYEGNNLETLAENNVPLLQNEA